ncbi:SAF domain-containing protein [Corynebacterium cystitidis]|uniref:SAF domain-containing protein n=1 Tax=Corynebacterium cystitidis TaxID=35757 RepID=UPI00211E3723|nr:SAF domain-containing protein [Corynebacterium cystitidis]
MKPPVASEFSPTISSTLSSARNALVTPGYQRARMLRRMLALALCVVALVSGLASLRATDPAIVTYAVDVPAGTVLNDDHLQLTRVPASIVPARSTDNVEEVVGQVAATHGSPGQPVATNHLLGEELTADFVRSDTAEGNGVIYTMVPVKLAEPDILPLLHSGDEVSVISTNADGAHPRVIAAGGRVILAGKESDAATDSVLISLSESDAHAVASASLNQPLTVVLTGERTRTTSPDGAPG